MAITCKTGIEACSGKISVDSGTMIYRKILKSILDFITAFVLIIILSPVIIIISILLLFVNKGQVFFIHQRPGLNEMPFYLYKFRTMNSRKDTDGVFLPNIYRITRIGNFLRKTSLDEIPQLLNVLKGDISLVGPRPLEMRYLNLYSEEQKKRHTVKPGLTGWAQVNGRNSLSWEDKFSLDIWYVNNMNFILDLKILFLTIWKILNKEGINSDNFNTVVPLDEYLKIKKESH